MNVLVTGGAGFIGSHIADRLLQENFQVRILDNLDPKIHPHGRPCYIPANAEFIEGSVTDAGVLRRALQGVDVVFHQAAYQDYMPDFSRYMVTNVVGTALLYELIVRDRLPVKKVIVASSQSVYGEGQCRCPEHGEFLPMPRGQQQLQDSRWEIPCPVCRRPAKPVLLREEFTNPFNQYAVSKLAEEKTAIGLGWLNGIPTVALRYSITQGPRQSLFNQYSGICRIFFSRALGKQPLLIYEDGNQTRDFVHVQDVVDANMLVLRSAAADFQVFNVGSGSPVSVLQYAEKVCRKLNVRLDLDLTGEYRRGDNRHSVSSIDKLKRLGWAPKHDLDKILGDFSSWIDSVGGIPENIPDAHAAMKEVGVVVKATTVSGAGVRV